MTLDNTDEGVLFAQYKLTPDPLIRQRIVENNIGLVIHIAKQFHNNSLYDLIQEGILGLIAAIDAYDPDHGVKLSDYAKYNIKSFIIKYINSNSSIVKSRKKINDISLDSEDEFEIKRIDSVADSQQLADELAIEKEYNSHVQIHVKQLKKLCRSRIENYIFNNRLYTIKPMTLREIGKKLNISYETVRLAEVKLLIKMRKCISQFPFQMLL